MVRMEETKEEEADRWGRVRLTWCLYVKEPRCHRKGRETLPKEKRNRWIEKKLSIYSGWVRNFESSL